MKMKYKLSIIPLGLSLLLIGCSVDEKSSKEEPEKQQSEKQVEANQEETVTDQADEEKEDEPTIQTGEPLPESLTQLAELLPGQTSYVGILEADEQKQIDELTKHLPTLSESPSNQELDEYYEALLSVFQQNFSGPEDLIDQMKFESMGSPDNEDPRMQFKENMNVMVILDASGSMGNFVGGETQMEAAKKAIASFVQGLPKEANVGLRVYGQEGTGSKSDKTMSCSSSEIIYPLSPYNEKTFTPVLNGVQPAGWTPTQLALNEAENDLSEYKGDKNTNIVYLVGDGISTCDDDPVSAAKKLYESDITPIVNVIGFNVDNAGQKQLKAVADATNGSYQDVQNADGLQEELNQATKVAENWKQWKASSEGWLENDRIGNGLDIFGYHAEELRKLIDERQQMEFAMQYLSNDKGVIPAEDFQYLLEKNKSYHAWIESEYDKLKLDLEALNDMKYNDAIKSLEEKYQGSLSKQ